MWLISKAKHTGSGEGFQSTLIGHSFLQLLTISISYEKENLRLLLIWGWFPASPLFTQPFIRVHIKEIIKALRHWPLCGEFTGDRWIPRTNGQ